MNGPDKSSPPPTEAAASETTQFPEARVRSSGSGQALLTASRMWWVTFLCLVGAIVLVWRSLPERGLVVTIQFPEGHGLKTGDAVRYRGIDVGTVTELSLSGALDAVDVQVELHAAAAELAREGTRFWIVRPQLSLTQVSGLETAVGAKYIAVSPGDRAAPEKFNFTGLRSAPPDEFRDHGLTVVLQSDRRHGISSGAPVRWRGVEVGQVLSAGLSADARHVNITVRIQSSYRRLVQSSSKFWVTSGFNVDVGLTGLHLNADSLSAIARGGVSFITPETTVDGDVRNGQLFRLHQEADDDWFESAAATPLVDFELPETVSVTGTRPSKILGMTRHKAFRQHGLITSSGSQPVLITADLPDSESDEGVKLPDLEIHPATGTPVVISGTPADQVSRTAHGVLRVTISKPAAENLQDAGIAARETLPSAPADVIIVSTASDGTRPVPVVTPVDRSALRVRDDVWVVDAEIVDELDLQQWHGSPVISADDGVVVGLLLVQPAATIVAPLTEP